MGVKDGGRLDGDAESMGVESGEPSGWKVGDGGGSGINGNGGDNVERCECRILFGSKKLAIYY